MTIFHTAVEHCIGNKARYNTHELKKCIDLIDEKDVNSGLTPLQLAAKHNLHECVNLLLDAGAYPYTVNVDGQNALHIFILSHAEGMHDLGMMRIGYSSRIVVMEI